MNIKIIKLRGVGDLNKERVVLVAKEKANSWDYAVGKAKKIGADFDPFMSFILFMPDILLKKGDMISLHTSKGEYNSYLLNGKAKVHNIYMGFDAPIWGKEDRVVIVELSNWSSESVSDISGK